jgi:hypothetical protein
MPRKRDREHPDDIGIDLAPSVTLEQRTALYEMHYRGPWPSTQGQADEILRQWRRSAPERPHPENAP